MSVLIPGEVGGRQGSRAMSRPCQREAVSFRRWGAHAIRDLLGAEAVEPDEADEAVEAIAALGRGVTEGN